MHAYAFFAVDQANRRAALPDRLLPRRIIACSPRAAGANADPLGYANDTASRSSICALACLIAPARSLRFLACPLRCISQPSWILADGRFSGRNPVAGDAGHAGRRVAGGIAEQE